MAVRADDGLLALTAITVHPAHHHHNPVCVPSTEVSSQTNDHNPDRHYSDHQAVDGGSNSDQLVRRTRRLIRHFGWWTRVLQLYSIPLHILYT